MPRGGRRTKGNTSARVGAPKDTMPKAESGAAVELAPIARRLLGKTGERLSIVGMGGMLVKDVKQSHANKLVSEAFDRGINYFDVAPFYGDAQERLGPALSRTESVRLSPAKRTSGTRAVRKRSSSNRCAFSKPTTSTSTSFII